MCGWTGPYSKAPYTHFAFVDRAVRFVNRHQRFDDRMLASPMNGGDA
jgi:hypothetical protein